MAYAAGVILLVMGVVIGIAMALQINAFTRGRSIISPRQLGLRIVCGVLLLIIVGMIYYGNPFWEAEAGAAENEIGKLWTRFNAYYEGNREAFKQEVGPNVGWELHIGTDEYEETKEYFVMVGVEVAEIDDLPAPVFAKVLPAGQFAVFTLRGEEMTAD